MFRRLLFLALALVLIGGQQSSFATEKKLQVDLVGVDFPGSEVLRAELLSVQSSLSNSSIPYWNRQLETDFRGRNLVMGKVDLEPILLNIPPNCDGSGAQRYIRFVRSEFYSRHSELSLLNRYLVIYTPRNSCIWEAISSLNEVGTWDGGMILNGTTKPFVISHEIGHALGLGHTNLIACQNGQRDGTWGSECRGIEYGGAIDLMGNVEVDSPLSTYHKWRLGTLMSEGVKQSWLDESIELNDINAKDGFRAILLRDGDSTYWIEYRSKRLGDYLPGLVVYRTDPPPASAILSPNPDDNLASNESSRLSTDIWLINLGDYRYLNGKAAGSMALPPKTEFEVASGDVRISASVLSETSVLVSIDRSDDRNPPPRPRLLRQSDWVSPSTPILDTGREYWDRETFISAYEVQAGDKVLELASEDSSWMPDLINPLIAPRVVAAQDLPEGSYSLQTRAIDIWGNRSPWSESIRVSIDRGFPTLSPKAFVDTYSKSNRSIQIEGASDLGSGVCRTRFLNPEGIVVGQNTEGNARNIRVLDSLSDSTQFQVFDCSGNGLSTSSVISIKERELTKLRRSGSWRQLQGMSGRGLECRGSCSASFTGKGSVTIFASKGAGRIFVNGKVHSQFSKTNSTSPGPIAKIDLSESSATIRITGTNIVLESIQSVTWKIGKTENIYLQRSLDLSDEGIEGQSSLSKLGFRSDDFDGNWTLQPLPRGYTLLEPSLDFCSDSYQSERNRTLRRQLVASKQGTSLSFVSTEVVRYKDARSAGDAFQELKDAIEKCQIAGGFVKSDGIEEKYDFLGAKPQIVERELGTHSANLRVKIGEGLQARWLMAYYNFKGDEFSGLYIVKVGSDFSTKEISNWNSVNSMLLSRLEES